MDENKTLAMYFYFIKLCNIYNLLGNNGVCFKMKILLIERS